MAVRLTIENDLQAMIYNLGKEAPNVAEKAVKESGKILLESLREQVTNNTELSERQKRLFLNNLEEKYEKAQWGALAEVGWLFKEYDAKNPAVGVLAIWAEYGTDERFTLLRLKRGYLSPAYFTTKARKKVAKTIRQRQEEIVDEAWKEVGKV